MRNPSTVSSRRQKTLPWISSTVAQSGSFLPTTTPVSFPGPRPESFLSWQRTPWMSLLGQWGLMNNLVDVVEGRVGNFISDNSWLKSSGQTKEQPDKSPFQNNSLLFPKSCSNNQLQHVGFLLKMSHCLQELFSHPFSATLDSCPPQCGKSKSREKSDKIGKIGFDFLLDFLAIMPKYHKMPKCLHFKSGSASEYFF